MRKQWDLYEAVIVAAGRSRRMGAFKPLLPLGDEVILERTIQNFREAGVNRITVVTGFRGDEIKKKLKNMQVEFVHNSAFAETDMLTSICLGIKNRKKDTKGILITPGDAPLIRSFTIAHVISCMEQGKGEIIVPVYRGKQGHPPVLSQTMAEQLLRYTGERGLGGFLDANRECCYKTQVPDPWICEDVDTPQQYETVKAAHANREIPDAELCQDIWEFAETPENIRRHCSKVAETAQRLWEMLVDEIPELKEPNTPDLILAGALLHDVKRQMHRHARAGADFLEALGYARVAQIVAAHTELLEDNITEFGPEVLVYLADRMVLHDQPCSVKQRYQEKRQKMQGSPEGLLRLAHDQRRCEMWFCRIKERTGYDLYE